MKNNIEELKDSLIYRMSLGSKELYHSNVWAWLIEQDYNFIKAFIPSLPDGYHFYSVNREEKNRDLTIWMKKDDKDWRCIIIENKLKSIPHKDQLEKYSKDAWRPIGCILTGLKKPNIADDSGNITLSDGSLWKFVSYSELSSKMAELLESTPSPVIQTYKEQIKEYLRNNQLVEEIVNDHIQENRYTQTYDGELDKLGLDDLINKVNGSLFVGYVNRRLKEDNIDIPYFFTWESFNNKKVTLDFRLSNWDDYMAKKFNYLKIGVQIEGSQYRRMIDRVDSYSSADQIFDEFSSKGFFDPDFKKGSHQISFPNDNGITRETSLRNKFDKYNNACIYQYSNLKDEDRNYESLYQRIKADLLLSSKLMEQNNLMPLKQ